jgi:hypothetical protein
MERIELTGLWIGETLKGDTKLTGYLGKGRIVIYENKHKQEEKHPDYIMYLETKPENQERSGEKSPQKAGIRRNENFNNNKQAKQIQKELEEEGNIIEEEE